jgi:hypothetical protein
MPRRAIWCLSFALAALAAGCADRLPDQDLRILSAGSAAKLSSDDLWQDFQKDAKAARRRYFGEAIDVSGKIMSIDVTAGKPPTILFSAADQHGVRARLLDDRAADIVKNAPVFSRITLRCYCEGFDDQQNVVLKSCIKP